MSHRFSNRFSRERIPKLSSSTPSARYNQQAIRAEAGIATHFVMAHGLADWLAGGRIPQLRSTVLGGGHDAGAVRIKSRRPHDVPVRHRFPERLTCLEIP